MDSVLFSLGAQAKTPRVFGPSGLAGPPRLLGPPRVFGPQPLPGPCPAAVPFRPTRQVPPPLQVVVLAAGRAGAARTAVVLAAHAVVVPEARRKGLDCSARTLSKVTKNADFFPSTTLFGRL